MALKRYEPYYGEDTDGVHFEVCVEGCYVQAYVSRQVLARRCGLDVEARSCLSLYVAHKDELDAAVARRVKAAGPETVILRIDELIAGACD